MMQGLITPQRPIAGLFPPTAPTIKPDSAARATPSKRRIADCGLRIADFLNLNRQSAIAKCIVRNCRPSSIRNPWPSILFVSSVFSILSRSKIERIIFGLLILVFSNYAFAQTPAGRERPKPARTDKNKSAAKPDKSGKAGNPAKPASRRAPSSRSTSVRAKLTIVAPPGTAVEVDGKPRGFDEVRAAVEEEAPGGAAGFDRGRAGNRNPHR